MGGSVGEAEFLDAMAARHGRSAERRSAPEDASGEDQRRTRQRRSSPGPRGPSSSAPSGVRPAARPTSSVPSVQGPFASWQPGPRIWSPVQPQTVADMQAVAGLARQPDAGQNRPVEQPPMSLFANSSHQPQFTFTTAASARAHARMAAQLQSQDLQRAVEQRAAEQRASMGPFGIRNTEQQQVDQQLQRQPTASRSGAPGSNIPRLRPAPPENATQGSLTRTTNSSEQAQAEAPSLFLGANRNRPW